MHRAATSVSLTLLLAFCVFTSCNARQLQQRKLLQDPIVVGVPGVSVVQQGSGTQVTFPGGSVNQDGQGNTQTSAPGANVVTEVDATNSSSSPQPGTTGRKLQDSDSVVTFPGGSVVQQGDKVAVDFPGGSFNHYGQGNTSTSVPGYAVVSTAGQAESTSG